MAWVAGIHFDQNGSVRSGSDGTFRTILQGPTTRGHGPRGWTSGNSGVGTARTYSGYVIADEEDAADGGDDEYR